MTRTVRAAHDEAMRYAQEAWLHRQCGQDADARILDRQALPYELEAIAILEPGGVFDPRNEPTRGILYLSAASLALAAGDRAMARQLVDAGLAGTPDARTRHELDTLLENAA